MTWIVLEPWCHRCRKALRHDEVVYAARGVTLCPRCAEPHASQMYREIFGGEAKG